MRVINLFAGPGAGKSTTAAGVFHLLKLRGVNAELVTEFAKDLTWEGRDQPLANQTYLLGEQCQRLERLQGKVDVVVTDSPLPLVLAYRDLRTPRSFERFVVDLFEGYDNTNYNLLRAKPYVAEGRNQTEGQARALDITTRRLLETWAIPYYTILGDESAARKIAADYLMNPST